MRRRPRARLDPWANGSMLDALLVARAERVERRDEGTGLVETSEELRKRLGFETVDEMRIWSDALRERQRERLEEVRRRRAAGERSQGV